MTTLCSTCHLPDREHELGGECAEARRLAMEALLRNIGELGVCSGCSARVIWVHHRNGKRTPYTPAGLNHFIDCPKADQFSTRKKVS